MSGPASFFQRVQARALAADSLLCVGLDPRAGSVSELEAECRRLIQATAPFAAAYKPNSAFFEAFGPDGLRALQRVIAAVPDGIPVILDAKRGDIADTAEAYARAAFEVLGADAVTASPYLGADSLRPLLTRPERGVFVLCKTSNPGSDDLQALRVAGGAGPLYEVVAHLAGGWSAHDNLGLVAGATDPQALASVRRAAPHLWLLVPGVGPQGGSLRAALAAGLRSDGLGLLINVSRSLALAPDPAAAAGALRAEINASRAGLPVSGGPAAAPAPPGLRSRLAQALLEAGIVQLGEFTLKSGLTSPVYLDLRRLVSHPRVMRLAAEAYAGVLAGLEFDRLAAVPYAGLPIATAIGLAMDRPVIYPRRELKDYGTRAAVEGEFAVGDTAVVIDDLATTGGSKLEAIDRLLAAGLRVRDIVVLVDREQGAAEGLRLAGYRLHSVVTLSELLTEWNRAGAAIPAASAA
jgi:uridine monophosphate synthetase